MSNYVWKQIESIRRDMVDALRNSGFGVMLMPARLTIQRGSEKIVEVNTKTTVPKVLMESASDSLYYRQDIAMMVTAMNAVIYLKKDIASAAKDKVHRAFGLYVKMIDYLHKHPTATQMPVYSDDELIGEGEKFLSETEVDIVDNKLSWHDVEKRHNRPVDFTSMMGGNNKPEKPKEVKITDDSIGKYYKKVMAALDDVAWKHSSITYKWRYGDGPYQEGNVPCLWFTVKFGGVKYKFKYTLPLDKWVVLQEHTEEFIEEHGLDSKFTKKLIKTVLVRMGLDYLFSNITIVDEVTANVTKNNIRKAWKVIESDIGKVYMPRGKYNTIFTHSVSNDCTVYIVNR